MSDRQNLLGNETNGHTETPQELKQQTLRNLYTGSAIPVQIGLLLVVGSVLYGVLTTPIILFSYHPIFNSLGFFLLGQGILITQPEPRSAAQKQVGGEIHGALNSLAVLAYVTGAGVILYNKEKNHAQHFYSWHGTFGIITYVLLVLVMLVGAAQFWWPAEVFGSVHKGRAIYKFHRVGGYAVWALTAFTILLALESDFNHNALHISYYTVAPGLLLVAVFFYKRANFSRMKIFG
ncbi:hypothetical protein CJU89_2310 [Yarrowia sp. B02]|nr:hypothetical protein CJU89_2310 [Yarrowia sp. B02]